MPSGAQSLQILLRFFFHAPRIVVLEIVLCFAGYKIIISNLINYKSEWILFFSVAEKDQ